MATIDFSQLSKIWKITAAGIGITLVAVGGTFWTLRTKNAAGIVTRTEYSDGRSTQSGELLVKSGSLAVSLRSNGDISAQGTISGNHLYTGTMSGAGLTDCDLPTDTLNWDSTTQRFVCGTDSTGAGASNWSNTGSLQTYFDPRYVNTSGDTMTGKLLINLTSGTDALEVVQTASASKLHANTLLTVSGSVVVEDNVTIDGLMSFVGYSASPQLTAADATSGLHFDGPGIVSLHNGGTQTMLLSSTNNVGIGIGSPETKLEVEGTVSGSVLFGLQSIRSSGALTWEGAGSGASLYLGGQFEGVGLVDCDLSTQTLSWDATTKRFSCGTDSDTTYTAAQGLTLNGSAFSLSATHSGSVIRATTTLASSGTVVWEGAASGSSLYVATSIEGSGLVDCDLATQTLAWDATTKRFSCGTDSDTTYTAGQGLTLTSTSLSLSATHSGTVIRAVTTLASSGGLVVEGTTSGAIIIASSKFSGAGLSDCDTAGTSKLLWDTTTQRFSCGTDTDTNTTYTAGQGLTLTSTSFRLNAIHSGTTIWGTSTLRSSGTLVWEGSGSGQSLNIGGGNVLYSTTGAFVWNENGYSMDFRLEGDTNSALFFLDGSADRIGIGTRTPDTTLDVVGTLSGSIIRGTTLSGNILRTGLYSPSPATVQLIPTGTGTSITTGSGRIRYTVPKTMSGFKLYDALFTVDTAGTTNTTAIQIRNLMKGSRKMFSTVISVDSAEKTSETAATPFVISAANADVGAGDYLYIDYTNVSTTAPKGGNITLYFYNPR